MNIIVKELKLAKKPSGSSCHPHGPPPYTFVKLVQWTPLNRITLGLTLTDPINGMITIIEYMSYTKYAIDRHLGSV